MNKRIFSFYLDSVAGARSSGSTPAMGGNLFLAGLAFVFNGGSSPPTNGLIIGWAPGSQLYSENNVAIVSPVPYNVLVEAAIDPKAQVSVNARQSILADSSSPLGAGSARNMWPLNIPIKTPDGFIALSLVASGIQNCSGVIIVYENVPDECLDDLFFLG